ncbi:MAG TPA: hypothetical protein VFK42_17495 [Acidimicrobiales bacterium]|nr:hypothetical protein [Acidimicrobiales bacterium]
MAVPAGLLEQLLRVSSVRPGVVDTAQRRLALAPLPSPPLLAASMVDVLVAARCS